MKNWSLLHWSSPVLWDYKKKISSFIKLNRNDFGPPVFNSKETSANASCNILFSFKGFTQHLLKLKMQQTALIKRDIFDSEFDKFV